MEHKLLWVWITLKSCMTATKITQLWDRFETIEDIYEAENYEGIEGIGEKEKKALLDKDLGDAERVCERMSRLNGKILVYDDKYFPDALRNIVDPPYVLYIKGSVLLWERHLMIGVVGTRKCTPYGKAAVNKIVPELASRGVVIISGMAEGIDGAAARAALAAGGKTVAVLGSGIDVIYPPSHEELYHQILSEGLIMTEYPPGTPAYRHNFPVRNRIIAGLSRGVLVAEAPSRSGSLITARIAQENGRDLFAVPGSIFDHHYDGSNRLINRGAKLTMDAGDIISEYPYEERFLKPAPADISSVFEPDINFDEDGVYEDDQKIEPEKKARAKNTKNTVKKAEPEEADDKSLAPAVSVDDKKYAMLNDKEKLIIKLLIEDNMHIDEIARAAEIPAAELNPIMVMLEMKRMIKKMPGNNFRLNL